MTVWWLRGYINGVYDLQYAAFSTYGECMATKAVEQINYPSHTFTVTKDKI